MDRLAHRDAVLCGAVVIGVVADADLAGRLDQRGEYRQARRRVGDADRTLAAAIGIVAAIVAFHALEERQHVFVAPAVVAHLRPGVEVLRLAAHERHAVDRAGAAEHLAARHRQAAAVGVGLGLRGVQPVGRGIGQQLGVADRDARPGMAGGTGLQQQHLVAGIRRQPVGDHRAGRPGADNDVVIALHLDSAPRFASPNGRTGAACQEAGQDGRLAKRGSDRCNTTCC